MRIEEIVIGAMLLYVIVFFASRKATESALKKYDAFKRQSSVELRLEELKHLKIIDDLEYNLAKDHYVNLHNSGIYSKKMDQYKSILLELESKEILQMDNCSSRIFDLEDIHREKSNNN